MVVSFFYANFATSNKNSEIMGKLKSRYRLGNRLLKIFETGRIIDGVYSPALRGVMYVFKWDTSVSPNRCYLEKKNAANFYEHNGEKDESKVLEHFDMLGATPVTSDNYINVHHRVIWTNNDYDEWKRCMEEDYPNGIDEDGEEIDLSYEHYHEDCDTFLWDERANLDVTVKGVIVCFADLGLWDGHHNGAKTFGDNVKNILSSHDCDYLDWYCDRFNVRCTGIHHDGTNTYLYRVAKDKETADDLVNKIAYHDMTAEEFMKATKSLRPYVAKVYGW